MTINATIIGQLLGFLVLVWFTWKFIWPPLLGAIEERQKKIAAGLAAADRGQKDLEEAKARAGDAMREARERAMQLVDQAQKRGNELIDEAKQTAVAEGERLVSAARAEVSTESARARDALRRDVAALALAGAGKVLGREVDAKAHADLLDQLAAELERG
ncbi:MAG: F0F1 ATP synthase subunit B [Steroidobacteraceae bacterium]|jgi:F-type H+-transporting ATPase subunit b|nr:F0F1 ATP synthase subunit B [Steroidobacteraceae bacterium]